MNAMVAADPNGAAGTGAALVNPHGMSSPLLIPVQWTLAPATAGTVYTATGLPPGLVMSPAGVVSGAATSTGSYTVTVTAGSTAGAAGAAGSSGSATFVWTAT